MTSQEQKAHFDQHTSKIYGNAYNKDFRVMCDKIAIEKMDIDPELYFNNSQFRHDFIVKCSIFAEQFKKEYQI